VLKIIDVDLKDTKVFEDAMSMFKETLERFSELSKN
jgi:oligoendopeptidase F